ncbi:PAS domain-containing protein, partial [Streptomyces sp. NPDC046805]|uniref:PAS domain-containing protein n=1 Tax=Streptomyces sp. NPDC046805 TaxID=3155134 RepID=UPI003406B2E0
MERPPTPPGEPTSTGTATATISEQGIVTGWSEGARRLLGYAPSEIVGRPAAALLADDVGDVHETVRRATVPGRAARGGWGAGGRPDGRPRAWGVDPAQR